MTPDILLYAVNPSCPEYDSAHSVVEELRTGKRAVVLTREHKLRTILTADKGFGRFKNLEVVHPVHT